MWLMWQMSGLGPMAGQAHHFLQYAREDLPYAKERYRGECRRLYTVLEKRLSGRDSLQANTVLLISLSSLGFSTPAP